MVANQKFTRVDTVEHKAVMYRKIGRRRANKYFDLLKKFFCLKVGKYEFDKSCMRILGKENLCLHNQLMRTILKNSCVGTVSPMRVKVHSLNSVSLSPRNGRSPGNRDRKFRDRASPLGPLGKSQQSATELLSLGSRPPIEVVSVEDGEEVEQAAESPGIQSRSTFTAPLGILVNKGARKALSGGTQKKLHALTCQQTCELPDAKSLMNQLEQKLEADGFNISVDCANVMNNGLDCYLKRLIEPCIRLMGSRCIKERPQHVIDQRITGLRGMLPVKERFLEKLSNSIYASLLDFCVVMESNPCILGGDWPVLLEKVEMVANQKSQVDTVEQKAVLYRKIGHQRADKYFDLLKKFFCLKVGKYEFDKSCMRILGKENLCLHNQLIRTILKNSCAGTVSPSRVKVQSLNSVPSSPPNGRSPTNRHCKFQGCPIEVAFVEDGEEVEQAVGSPGIQSKSPFVAPLGIVVNKGAHKALSGGTQKKLHALTCQKTCELPDAKSLMNHLEQELEADGFNISVDCANVMNNALDCYLKRLIEPCLRLAGSRCIKERSQHVTDQRISGLRGMLPVKERFLEKLSNSIDVSLLDFCAVMESNPCVLGGDWPVLLEKVRARARALEE